MWWSTARGKKPTIKSETTNKSAHFFHFDLDRPKWLKLFIYLSDVGNLNGPHIYIKNSGDKSFIEYLDRRITDEEANIKYKRPSITSTKPMLIISISCINFEYLSHRRTFHKLHLVLLPWTFQYLQMCLYKLALFLKNQKTLDLNHKHHRGFCFF